ncbi:MAG TPA: GDYXXLXY domain-containing protein [Chitinolyticbacter sp.]|nr:GDYXXLXY domain-containing protein [Chitinolyticbacter sp.]
MNRRYWPLLAALPALLVFNLIVAGHERTLASGDAVLLPLRPVDPRSLMQGDYMALDYALTERIDATIAAARWAPQRGDVLYAYLRRDQYGIGQLQRVGNVASKPRAGELVLKLRWENHGAKLPTHSYFFAEGEGERFAQARYASWRIGAHGTALLEGLADRDRRAIAPGRMPAAKDN